MKRIFILVATVILIVGMIPMHAQEEILLRIGCQDEPKTLNIWKATDVWSVHACAWFYPSLYYRKPVTLEPMPDVCYITLDEVYANSPDGLTFTFPLRDDVSWDDGMPVTAYDFEFYYTIIVELEIPDYMPIYEDVEYVRAVDDYTLEMKLAKCTPQFEESIIFHSAVPEQQFGPMLEEARGTEVPMQHFLDMPVDEPISAGPFSFDRWEKGSFVKLVTNPDYYGKGRTVYVEGVGEIEEGPWYDGLLLKLYGTTDAALLGIQKGEIDYIWWNLDPGYIAQVLGNPDITIEKSDELGFYYLAPNIAIEPFDDLVLRQALVYLVDKEFIVSRVLQGYGGAAHSVVMPAAGDWYCETNKYGSGMSTEERIAKATEMLTAAGYTVPYAGYPGDVLKLPDGTEMKPFEILTPPADYDPMRAMSGVLIQEWWRAIGVPVTAKPTSFGEIVHKTFEAMTFDWYILGWRIGGSGYADHMRYFFHSDQAVPDGNNPMSYKNPQVDKYLEDLMTLCDRDELLYAACEAQKLIIEEVGYCPLYYRTLNEAHRNDTFDGWFTQLGGIAGTESPRSCLLYLTPRFIPDTETKEEKAIVYEEEARRYEAEARRYEASGEWENAAVTRGYAAMAWENAAKIWGNPISNERSANDWGHAGDNYKYGGDDWIEAENPIKAAEYYEKSARDYEKEAEKWEDSGKSEKAKTALEKAAGEWEKAENIYENNGYTEEADEAHENAQEALEKADSIDGGICKGGFCLGTLFIALLLFGGIPKYFKKK